MARKVKVISEDDATPAAATLHPGAAPSDGGSYDPTHSEMLAYALQVMGGMTKDDLNGFLASMQQNSQSYSANIPDGASDRNRGTIMAKPSAAISEEDISALFEGQDVSEDFILQAKTIFEAALDARLTLEAANLQEQYEMLVEEAYQEVTEQMADKLDQYMNYVVSEWMDENELVLDNGVKNEVLGSFMEGLKDLFAEHYVDVPEEQVDAVEALADRIAELEDRLNDALEDNMDLASELEEAEKATVLESALVDLSDDEAEKLITLSEGLDYTDQNTFATKVAMLKESISSSYDYFPKHRPTGLITEDVFLSEDDYRRSEAPVNSGSPVSAYANHISRTVKKV
jgi:hypothetical protein